MNKIEKTFFDVMNEWLRKDFINLNEVDYQIMQEKEEFCFLPNREDKGVFWLSFVAQPKDDCFSGYIPDFAIFINRMNKGIVIEIDGYEWHEKSKEQARIDKEKDRAYLKKGFIPIRFTGYEVYHNVTGCIREVFEIISSNSDFFESNSLKEQLQTNCEYTTHIEDVLNKQEQRLHLYESGKYTERAFNVFRGYIELNPNLKLCI